MSIIKVEPVCGNEEGMLTVIFLFEHLEGENFLGGYIYAEVNMHTLIHKSHVA